MSKAAFALLGVLILGTLGVSSVRAQQPGYPPPADQQQLPSPPRANRPINSIRLTRSKAIPIRVPAA